MNSGVFTDCLDCTHCTLLKAGRKKDKPHPCTITLHPSEPPVPGRLFKLFTILKELIPKEVWKTFRKPRGYQKKTHFRPKPVTPKELPSTRISITPSRLPSIRAKMRTNITLRSESPLKVLQAFHGTDVLLHSYRPIEFQKPLNGMEIEELERLRQKDKAKFLASQRGLCVGGIETRLSTLENLKPIEPSDELKELEPLRAMSLQEVTNVSLLIQASHEEEEH